MSKKVTIGTTDYLLPQQGESPKWGEDLSSIIEALINSVNNEFGPNDILESSATIANSGTFPAPVSGYYFDPSEVRSFSSDYNISRKITKALDSTSGDGSIITINSVGEHYLLPGQAVTISGSVIGLSGMKTVLSTPTPTSFRVFGIYTGNNNTETFQVELLESGTLYGNYGIQGWKISRISTGDARVDLDINGLGNITYNPEILIGSGYVGIIRFLGKAIRNS